LSRTFRRTKYLIDLYRAFIEKKGKYIKTNFTLQRSLHDDDDINLEDINIDVTHLDVADFF
jgi:hypothetical protein